MLIAIIGGVGEGKTLAVIREILRSKNYPLTNFELKGIDYYRLKYEDLLKYNLKAKNIPSSVQVNWKFWDDMRKKKKNFSIILDEVHNLIDARGSNTRVNKALSKWVSQIRKVTQNSKTNHLYIISQTEKRIDVNFRDLTQVVITCKNTEFEDGDCLITLKYYDGFEGYENRIVKGKEIFYGNTYFKYYDTKEMVKFEDIEKYI